MSEITVAPIVEGHGEQASAIRSLLTRLWTGLLKADFIEVLQPIRRPKSKLVQEAELLRAVDLAALKLGQCSPARRKLILVLLDADEDLPCVLGSALQTLLLNKRPHLDSAVVIANVEYETWFVAAAESLKHYFDLSAGYISDDPEAERQGKATVTKLMHGKYGETVDQPRLSAAMDLTLCRKRSPSFDKLCRELERRLA
jgi:hypothetical protein